MCGINGFNFDDEALAKRMNKSIKHRGPDDEGVFIDKGMTLAMVRLAILDPTKEGSQPMTSMDGSCVIVHNGEVYNFKELRGELQRKGYTFRSNTDTEVVLNAYIEYGRECLNKFNGMFAFAIWDKKREELFCARDHIGIKPFVYHHKNGRFAFSSEIKGLLEYGVPRTIDATSLNMFFRFSYVEGPETIFRDIYKLPPGCFLTLKGGALRIERYWEIKLSQEFSSFEEARNAVREVFDRSVERQLVSDKPLGVFLGGGIDSTAIVGAMATYVSRPIQTFSVRFATNVQERKFNEDSVLALKTSARYRTEHRELTVSGKDVAEHLSAIVYHMDDLVANNSMIAPFLLSKFAKQFVDVVLGGDGGDEVFGGYERYYLYHRIEQLQKIPKVFRDNFLVRFAGRAVGLEKHIRTLNAPSGTELFFKLRAQDERALAQCLANEFSNLEAVKERVRQKHFREPFFSYAANMMKVDATMWLVDESLAKTDKLTMAWGLEERVPLLDKELVELAFSIPASFKVRTRRQGKFVFKEAVQDYLSPSVYGKPKTGWFAPASKWLRNELYEFAREVLSDGYVRGTEDYINLPQARALLKDHVEERRYALNILWSLITFQIWYRKFLKS